MSDIFYNSLLKNIRKCANSGNVRHLDPKVWEEFNLTFEELKQKNNVAENNSETVHNTNNSIVIDCCANCPLTDNKENSIKGHGGTENVKVMFIGDTPGKKNENENVPFSGKAGEMIKKMVTAMGLGEDEVFYTTLVKCRPENNRTPNIQEATSCLQKLQNEINDIKPKVIVLMGAATVNLMYECNEPLSNIRGQWLDWYGIAVMPTFHPNYLLREVDAKRDAWNDLKLVMNFLNMKG